MKALSSGFMLLELIVALTILGLGFSALFAGMSQSSRNIIKLEAVQQREREVRNLLAQLQLVQQLTPGDSASGRFDDAMRWRMEVEPFVLPTAQNGSGIVRIQLRLEWDAPAGLQRRTIETYRRIQSVFASRSLEQQLAELR